MTAAGPVQRCAQLARSLARVGTARCNAASRRLADVRTDAQARAELADPRTLACTSDASPTTRRKLRALIGAAAKPSFRPSTDERRSWWPLIVGTAHNAEMRSAMDGRSGVYAFKDARTRDVLYVGESHTGRAWSTMLRHTHAQATFEAVGEWTARRPERLLVAFMPTTPAAALLEESNWIRELRPAANLKGYSDRGIEDEPAPF